MYTIAVDAMGGDRAPKEIVVGAITASVEGVAKVILVGDENKIKQVFEQEKLEPKNYEILHTEEYITMDENPTTALKNKKNASMLLAAQLVKEGRADAIVSAGNTGALMQAALFILGRIEGIKRPAIITFWPNNKGVGMLLDSGANADCKPEYLLQFAQMGTIYAEKIMGVKNPKVGLLNIGSEPMKGNELVKESYEVLKNSKLNFVGNTEMRAFFSGDIDIGVCDGFVGNMILKTSEAVAEHLERTLKAEVKKSFIAILGALLLKPSIMKIRKQLDHAERGGAPLLGVKGVCIKSHGRANARTIYNAVKIAAKAVENNIIGCMESMNR